jgi:hypothetical protein
VKKDSTKLTSRNLAVGMFDIRNWRPYLCFSSRAKKRFGLIVLNYTVASNHIHRTLFGVPPQAGAV